MKNTLLITLIFCSLGLSSCKLSFNYSPESMKALNEELKDKFGDEAWYTSIIIRKALTAEGNIIAVTETKDPNSLKQRQWLFRDGIWDVMANVTVQINSGKPQDYMFQLDHKVHFSLLIRLMERSQKKLTTEENVNDAQFDFVSITSKNERSNLEVGFIYTISYFSKESNKSYSFVYNLKGELIAFNK